MGILDIIKNILSKNKPNAQIYCTTLKKTYGQSEPLEIGLYNNKTPIANTPITININNKEYTRTTDSNGIAKLNINLPVGSYRAYIKFQSETYNNVTAYTDVIIAVDTYIDGVNLTKNKGDNTPYQCAVYRKDTNQRIAGTVNLTINGKTYARTPDPSGLYKLNINLPVGNYQLKAEFTGTDNFNPSSTLNTITVNEAPEPEPEPECTNPYESTPHPTKYGCNGMGQNNSVCCGPSALHKILYKFGIRDITQGTLSGWAGTTSGGTSHQGLATAIAQVNRVKGTNITLDWYNLSDLDWKTIGEIICQPNKAVFCHILYQNGGTCDGDGEAGHYELLTRVNTKTRYVQVLNSLGGYCGDCYCGYYQDRTMACQEHFIHGISQKSIAVVTLR